MLVSYVGVGLQSVTADSIVVGGRYTKEMQSTCICERYKNGEVKDDAW